MNLLSKYIPHYSGHVESIEYDEELGTLSIVFFDRPEQFNPALLLTFSGVTELQLDIYDFDEDCIELIIGLDLINGSYCLHTDQREFNFSAKNVGVRDIAT